MADPRFAATVRRIHEKHRIAVLRDATSKRVREIMSEMGVGVAYGDLAQLRAYDPEMLCKVNKQHG